MVGKITSCIVVAEYVACNKAYLLGCAVGQMAVLYVPVQIFGREGDGFGGDVYACEGEGKLWRGGVLVRRGEESMEQEGDAAGAGAEVEDAEGGTTRRWRE